MTQRWTFLWHIGGKLLSTCRPMIHHEWTAKYGQQVVRQKPTPKPLYLQSGERVTQKETIVQLDIIHQHTNVGLPSHLWAALTLQKTHFIKKKKEKKFAFILMRNYSGYCPVQCQWMLFVNLENHAFVFSFLHFSFFFYNSTVCCWNDSLRKGYVYCKIMYIWRISSFILWIYLWHNLTINCLFFFIKRLFVLTDTCTNLTYWNY